MRLIFWCVMLATTLAVSLPGHAELGKDVASVQQDLAKMQGILHRTQRTTAYTRHEIQADSGTIVREYASPGGRVFAITWEGPVVPDLKQLMGSYFEQYTRAAQNRRAGRGPLRLQESGLVVELSGHLRSFQGRAYVPEMLPEGVRVEEIE